MPAEIFLVKVGMSMTEGVVEEWYVPDGGSVRKGELLYRLETEKVNLDVDAEYSGIVKHLVAEGVTMAPGDVIGYLYAEDEAIPERLPDVGSATAHQARPAPAVESAASAGPEGSTPSQLPGGRVRVSPVARRLAREGRIDLTTLTGSGPAGRIVEADVLAAHSARQESARPETDDSRRRSSPMARKLARELGVDMSLVAGTGPGGRITRQDVEQQQAAISTHGAEHATAQADIPVPLTSMRRTIARRMHDSLQSMAQLTMDMDVVMDDAIKLRAQLIDEWADDSIRPTYTDLVIRAAAKALEKHQLMNASFGTAEIILHGAINVGMAVALDDGLIVPVIRSANGLSMRALVQECARLAAAAREGNLRVEELQNGTFTVTALGMYDVDSFTPIINAPQAGILGVNRIRDDIAWDGNRPVRQQRMKLSLTWDHRVLDGAPAARFLASVRDFLESPYRLLV